MIGGIGAAACRGAHHGDCQRLTAAAEAIVLAGTDLGLAFDGRDAGYRVIDALDVHVDVLARLATGQTALGAVEAAR